MSRIGTQSQEVMIIGITFKSVIMRIDESIAFALLKGRKVSKKEIKEKFWPDSTQRGRDQNMLNLCNGTTQKIDPSWVHIMVEMCGVDANFLFDVKPMEP
jgi:hypothetical protein